MNMAMNIYLKTNINSEVTAKIDEVNKAIKFFEGNLLAMKILLANITRKISVMRFYILRLVSFLSIK